MNINRIQKKLALLKERKEKALVLFLTAGYPSCDSTVSLVLQFAQAGADMIELGMPFSDPLADGPVIQASSQQAIKNGITLNRILKQVKDIRKQSDIPIILMGYLNPLLQYGEEKFFNDAMNAGVDGVILPEIPLEESDRYIAITRKYHLADILLVSPATTTDRIQQIDNVSSGFLYCVSTTGVTGRSNIGDIKGYVQRVKKAAIENPVLVGFGIQTPEDAKNIAKHADGVIIGSALLRKIKDGESTSSICQYIGAMHAVLKGA